VVVPRNLVELVVRVFLEYFAQLTQSISPVNTDLLS